jgi:hypothetical protein
MHVGLPVCTALALLSAIGLVQGQGAAASFQQQNGLDAMRLDGGWAHPDAPRGALLAPASLALIADTMCARPCTPRPCTGAKAATTPGTACAPDGVICVGNAVGRCINGRVDTLTTTCAGGLSCQVLPLVNKPGISIACDTEADKVARIQAALGGAPRRLVRRQAGANKAGEFICIDDTRVGAGCA